MRIRLKDVRVGPRIRRDPGDLTALRESMRRLGVLQPILVDSDNRLVAGFRRLEAARELGWETIEARVIDVDNRRERVLMEAEENTTRRDFAPEDLARIEELMERYSREGLFWRFWAWLRDLIDRLFRR